MAERALITKASEAKWKAPPSRMQKSEHTRSIKSSAPQTKLRIGQPNDVYEQEADRVAEQIMRMPDPVLQRRCPKCNEDEKKVLQTKQSPVQTPSTAGQDIPPIVQDVLRSPGQPLDAVTRAFMEPRFGHDFSGVRVHTDAKAAESARAVNALAYTVGYNMIFGAGQYAPKTLKGGRLLAHELTHVIQQNVDSKESTSDEPDAVRFKISKNEVSLKPLTSVEGHIIPSQPSNSKRGGKESSSSLRVGIIPIREFIRHVETVERTYPTMSPQEILTMIRRLYYGVQAGSPGFEGLIPDAPKGVVEMCIDSEGSHCEEPVGTCICTDAQGLAMSRLRQHADENEIADNPSPYIEVGKDLIDVGHVLVGVDAILHPRTTIPFSTHGLTSAPGPATWEGDVGAAMVYLAEHRANGSKSSDVYGNPSPTVESYYRNSVPMSDILGDVDAFGMASMVGSQTLSTALRSYYVSESGGSPRYQYNRWRGFCSRVNLTYIQSGNNISWTPATKQLVIDRITAFANLFYGRKNLVKALTIGISPRVWPEAGNFADLFLADLKSKLEQEIAAQTGP